jgi:hypothetical protein
VIGFVLIERRARLPVIPRHRSGVAVCILSFAMGVSFVGAEGFLPLDLQAGVGWTVFEASTPLILSTVLWTLGTVLASQLDWTLRRLVGIGAAIVGVTSLAMALPVLGGWPVAAGYSLSGLGMGLASPALFGAVLGDDQGSEGRESAAVATARTIGGGIGVGVAGAIVLGLTSHATLNAAERGVAPLPHLHTAAHVGFGLLAAVTLAALPATAWVRLRRRSNFV